MKVKIVITEKQDRIEYEINRAVQEIEAQAATNGMKIAFHQVQLWHRGTAIFAIIQYEEKPIAKGMK